MNCSHIKLITTLLLPIVFFSCEKNAFFNAGDKVSREVPLAKSFKSIEIQAILDIKLVQDTINKAIITCGENLQPDIDVYVKDSTLYLKSSTKYNWSRSYDKTEIELHLVSVPAINVRKACSISSQDTIRTKEFFLIDWESYTELNVILDVTNCAIDVSSENFGHYTLKGKAVNATYNGWGSAFIYADELKAYNCTVKQRSIGDIYVNFTNKLFVTIETKGRVFYRGNPSSIIPKNNFSESSLVRISN